MRTLAYSILKQTVCDVNIALGRSGLVVLTWGNASGVDRTADSGRGVMAIKPSGVEYERLTPDDIVIVSLATGQVLEGSHRPSSDTPTHLELYRAFQRIGGIVHTHSLNATVFAQAQREIDCLGTTHADHFRGTVPVTRRLTKQEIDADYELNTGKVIVERFRETKLDPDHMPAVLVASHAPFVWGSTPEKALENAIALEAVARMQLDVYRLTAEAPPIPEALLDKHFLRKHGPGAYYGQQKNM